MNNKYYTKKEVSSLVDIGKLLQRFTKISNKNNAILRLSMNGRSKGL